MSRALLALVLIGLTMLAVAWFAERPGEVAIVWQGWRMDAPLGVLLIAMVVVGALIAMIVRLSGMILGLPRAFALWRRERRRRPGYMALTRGLVAVAAGDPREAMRQARRADVLLDDPPLTLLLSAQAAQLAGDETTAALHFNRMLARPETEFLGLRGLLTQALKIKDHARALDLAKRARALRPDAAWLLGALIELETRAGDWQGAVATLEQARKVGVLTREDAKHHAATALIELSRRALEAGRDAEATRYAEHAHRAASRHPYAAIWLATRYATDGQNRAATRLIESEWARQPHPDLLAPYRQARGAGEPLAWMRTVARLAERAAGSRDSLVALGAAALDAGLWGEARRYLGAAVARAKPTASLCRLMARLEDEEKRDREASREWLTRAASAPPDPAWVCAACGSAHGEWRAVCQRCESFDQLVWRGPEFVASAPAVLAAPARQGESAESPPLAQPNPA